MKGTISTVASAPKFVKIGQLVLKLGHASKNLFLISVKKEKQAKREGKWKGKTSHGT
jgi:hypothetical protein